MRARLRALGASHGEFEARGLRAEGKGWPPPILRGISGDADAAPELAELLDDADVAIRRKAAELLFELRRPETAPALRLALTRDEEFARDFIARHQDKLVYGSDCSDHVGSGAACQGAQTIATIRRLSPSQAVERKLLYGNAKKLFRL